MKGWGIDMRRYSRDSEIDHRAQVPNPLFTAEEFERFHHLDLASMSKGELLRERDREKMILVMTDTPDCWHVERFRAVEEALGYESK